MAMMMMMMIWRGKGVRVYMKMTHMYTRSMQTYSMQVHMHTMIMSVGSKMWQVHTEKVSMVPQLRRYCNRVVKIQRRITIVVPVRWLTKHGGIHLSNRVVILWEVQRLRVAVVKWLTEHKKTTWRLMILKTIQRCMIVRAQRCRILPSQQVVSMQAPPLAEALCMQMQTQVQAWSVTM
jgi:hypothetical protein